MKRTPFVVVGTAVGLAAVLGFKSTPVTVHLNIPTASVGSSGATGVTGATGSSTTTTTATGLAVGMSASTTTAATVSFARASASATFQPAVTATLTAYQVPVKSLTLSSHTTTTAKKPTTTTTAKKGTTTVKKTVSGPQVNYYYGVLSVKVTVLHKKITAITLAQLTDGGNPRSAQIDNAALPILESQILHLSQTQQHSMAVSSNTPKLNLASVSGATYTSAGFDVSLQYALSGLKKLGLI